MVAADRTASPLSAASAATNSCRDRCDHCDGTGVVEWWEGDPDVAMGVNRFTDDCNHCGGTGLLESDSDDRSCDPEHYLEDEQ